MALDALLADALADARALIREYRGHDLWEADIDWEQPMQLQTVHVDGGNEDQCRVIDTRISHAVGFVHGVALALDMTALQLLDEVPEGMQPLVYRCPLPRCRWVGSDPDLWTRDQPTCPACWKIDRKMRDVVISGRRPVPWRARPSRAHATPIRHRVAGSPRTSSRWTIAIEATLADTNNRTTP